MSSAIIVWKCRVLRPDEEVWVLSKDVASSEIYKYANGHHVLSVHRVANPNDRVARLLYSTDVPC